MALTGMQASQGFLLTREEKYMSFSSYSILILIDGILGLTVDWIPLTMEEVTNDFLPYGEGVALGGRPLF